MLNDEQKRIVVRTLKHRKLMIISGLMSVLCVLLGFATRTFKFDGNFSDYANIYFLGIVIETGILLFAFIVHFLVYYFGKSDSVWDFISTRDIDGNIDFKRLVEENNIKPKKGIIQILFLSFVFLTNIIAINPVKLTTYPIEAKIQKIRDVSSADGYDSTVYDFPMGTIGINYCVRIAENHDELYKTNLSIYFNEKMSLDAVTYEYFYNIELSEEENFKEADKAFLKFKEEYVKFIDEGIIKDNVGKDYYFLADEFKDSCLKQSDEEYVYWHDNHFESGYNVLYSKFNSSYENIPIISLSVMFD